MDNSRATVEHKLRELDQAFLNAVLNHDVDFVQRTLPDDFLSVFPDGRVADKAAELENVQTVQLDSFSTDEMQVHWYGDTIAILNFRLSLKMQGQEIKQVRDSHVYVQRNGDWQMVMGQTTPISMLNNAVAALPTTATSRNEYNECESLDSNSTRFAQTAESNCDGSSDSDEIEFSKRSD
jgi:hypothetical protein